MKQGFGKLITKDMVYEGEFVNNQKEGQGTLKYQNKIYKGEFSKNKPHGKGKLFYDDGTVLEGNWIKGKFEEEGNGLEISEIDIKNESNNKLDN